MQCCGFQQSLSVPQVSLNTAWPSQLRHVRHRAKNTPNSSTSTPHPPLRLSAITTGHLGDAADDRQHAAPVDYASKDRKQLWKAAIKLPMYSVGVVPVLVGAAAAYYDHGIVPWARVAGLVVGSICVIAWLNLSNDAFDATTGVDVHKAESVVNLTGGNRTLVLLLSKAFLVAGLGLLGCSIAAAADGRVSGMLAAAIACGYVYQGPPFRFSYKGLGEPLCFWSFGPLATTAFYLACSASAASSTTSIAAATAPATGAAGGGGLSTLLAGVSDLVLLLSTVVGITTTVILFCSHWHQIQGDIAAGKMSPLVRLGTARACKVLLAATASPYLIALAAAAGGICPLPVLAALLLSLPAAKALLDYAWTHHTDPARIAILKRYGLKWHMAVGAALVAGLAGAKVLVP